MKWRKEGPHLSISDEGYKVARFQAGNQVSYRPSLLGSFISEPKPTPAEAAKACDAHFKEAQCRAQS